MFSKFFSWLLSLALAFGAGAAIGTSYQPDEELKEKVSGHVDVIVDEAAGIVDDVSEAAKKRRDELESEWETSELYQDAKEFGESGQEIVDNTKADIEEHFGSEEAEAEPLTE